MILKSLIFALPTDSNPLLSTFKDELLNVYFSCLQDDAISLQLLGLQGFRLVAMAPGKHLTHHDLSDRTPQLVNKLLCRNTDDEVRYVCLIYLFVEMYKCPGSIACFGKRSLNPIMLLPHIASCLQIKTICPTRSRDNYLPKDLFF